MLGLMRCTLAIEERFKPIRGLSLLCALTNPFEYSSFDTPSLPFSLSS